MHQNGEATRCKPLEQALGLVVERPHASFRSAASAGWISASDNAARSDRVVVESRHGRTVNLLQL